MSKEPKVSVVIVNYNGKEFIEECIDSVLESNYPNFEIVLVDNGSTDGSVELLKKNHGNSNKVKLIFSKENLYFAGGNNLGAKHATGDNLIFLNSDTKVDPQWIDELVACAGNNDLYLVQPKVYIYDHPDILDSTGGIYTFWGIGIGRGGRELDKKQYDTKTDIDVIVGTVFMIDRAFYNRLGGMDEWYKFHYEDVDLSLRAKKLGGVCKYCPKSIVYHKVSLTFKKNIKKPEFSYNVRKNCLRTVIKNNTGIMRIIKLTGLLCMFIPLILQDIINFRQWQPFLTIRSIYTAFFNANYKKI